MVVAKKAPCLTISFALPHLCAHITVWLNNPSANLHVSPFVSEETPAGILQRTSQSLALGLQSSIAAAALAAVLHYPHAEGAGQNQFLPDACDCAALELAIQCAQPSGQAQELLLWSALPAAS